MAEAAVELDDGGGAVVADVAEDDTVGGRLPTLPLASREAMGAFDPCQVAVLEHRVGARGDVVENLEHPAATT